LKHLNIALVHVACKVMHIIASGLICAFVIGQLTEHNHGLHCNVSLYLCILQESKKENIVMSTLCHAQPLASLSCFRSVFEMLQVLIS